MEVETTRCHTQGHPEFRLVCDDEVTSRLGAAPLVSWLEERVLAGETFRPGEGLQIGWMFGQVFGRPDGTLGIFEPDFKTVPVVWQDGVTLTLRHAWFQKEVAASVALSPSFPSYRQSVIVCSRLEGASTILMHREQPSDLDSGWFIGCYDDDHDHQDFTQLTTVSLYEAAVSLNRRFIEYVALPPGCHIVTGQGPPFISIQDKVLEVVPGTLFSARGMQS